MTHIKVRDFGRDDEDDQPDHDEAYPEHVKQKEILAASQAIGEFIDFGPYTLCESVTREDYEAALARGVSDPVRPGYYPVTKSINQILADYFDIDLDVIEEEKRDMLDKLRLQGGDSDDADDA